MTVNEALHVARLTEWEAAGIGESREALSVLAAEVERLRVYRALCERAAGLLARVDTYEKPAGTNDWLRDFEKMEGEVTPREMARRFNQAQSALKAARDAALDAGVDPDDAYEVYHRAMARLMAEYDAAVDLDISRRQEAAC